MSTNLDAYQQFVYDYNMQQFYLSQQVSNIVAFYVFCLLMIFLWYCLILFLFVLLPFYFYKCLRGDVLC